MADINQLPALPLGTSDFEALRDSGQIYVDKTGLIYEMASLRRKFFLTRPRRFGKSLLVSTFASLFKNGLKYFSGLAIEKLWQDETYNVIEIDFSLVKNFKNFEGFEASLRSLLVRAFAKRGFVFDRSLESEWIDQISDWLGTQPKNSFVLLIDEYDAPLTACLNDKSLFSKVRTLLSDFYAVVNSNDDCWRFVFMTGITKFNQTGSFSELNNFTDISLDPLYAPLLGYTEEEIDRYFSGYVEEAAKALNLSTEELRRRLRKNYDGYCFDKNASLHVYAPWSVLNFLSNPKEGFENYWVQSGGKISLLLKYLHSPTLCSPEHYAVEKRINIDDLKGSSDFDGINDLVLLTQTGYLTIKQHVGRFFHVDYPNKEVADSLARLYTDMLLRNRSLYSYGAGALAAAVRNGDADLLIDQANHAFAAIDYQQHPITNEKHCQAFLLVFLKGLGFSAAPVQHGVLGRSYLEVEAPKVHWMIELKFLRKGESAEAMLATAAEQFAEKQYETVSTKLVIRVAAIFSEEKCSFVRWQRVVDGTNHGVAASDELTQVDVK